MGSAATAIHGAAIEPGDIDIMIQTAAEVHTAAAILPSRPDRWPGSDPGSWHSSVDQPVLTWSDHTGTRWTFGRWTINRTKIELANLDPPEPTEALIETGAAQSLAIELDPDASESTTSGELRTIRLWRVGAECRKASAGSTGYGLGTDHDAS